MLHSLRSRRGLAAGLVTVALVAGACGGGDDTTTTGAGDGGGEALSGQIVVSGSSTVEPISVAVAGRFDDLHPDVAISVDGPGTGDGFELFCNGETDISDASRPIKQEEIEACQANGVEFIELKVAFDGMAVMVNPQNPVECMSFADFYALVGPESDGIDTWAEAEAFAEELGSDTDLPDDLDLTISAPGQESGTYDSFVEIALEGIAEERNEEATTRPYGGQANDNVIIDGIAGAPGGFGWVGFAFAEGALGVNVVEVEGEDGTCTPASAETIADGSYPLSRPLFIYVNKAKAEQTPAVAAYVDYYLSEEGIAAVEETGYVMLPADQLAETRQTWESRTTGSTA